MSLRRTFGPVFARLCLADIARCAARTGAGGHGHRAQWNAKTNLAAIARKPIDQAIARIKFQAGKQASERTEVSAWLKAHP